jgi:hypothetical protein
MPRQRVAATRDDAGSAFQAAVVLDVNQAVVAERVNARGTDERAELDRAFGSAHVVVDRDMTLGINLVSVETEFGFDVDWHRTSVHVCDFSHAL